MIKTIEPGIFLCAARPKKRDREQSDYVIKTFLQNAND